MGWSETQRGFILSSFYIGYILTQIIGGLLSDRMGAKIVMGGFLVSRLLCEKRVVSLFGFGSCPQEQPHLV